MTAVAEAPEVTASTQEAPPPIVTWDALTLDQRAGSIPTAFVEHIRSVDGHNPPLWYGGSTRTLVNAPMRDDQTGWHACPPVEPGEKILSMDDPRAPRPLTVVERKGDTVIGMHGAIKVRSVLWLRLSEDYVFPEAPQPRGRLSKEEADKVAEEIASWSKFLGKQAVKYNWCSEYESVCDRIKIEPFRPGYSKVVVRGSKPFTDESLNALITEKFGEGATPINGGVLVSIDVTITDVTWEDMIHGRFHEYLEKVGHGDLSSISVVSKEVAE